MDGRRILDALLDLVPGLMIFLLVMLDPPPREAVPWITMAYSPLLLWALIRKVDADSRIIGIPIRRRVMTLRLTDIATQTTLIGLLGMFTRWPF